MNNRRIAGPGSRWIAALAATFIVSAATAQEAPPVMSDWGGARTTLRDRHGINIAINYIGETLQVMSGGLRRDASFEGRLELAVDTDLEKLVGIKGLSAHAKLFQIHNGGRNAADNVGSLFDPSNIDALRTTRLFTAVGAAEFLGRCDFNSRRPARGRR